MIKQVYSFDFKKEIEDGTTVVNFYSNLGSPSKLVAPVFNEVKDEVADKAKFLKVNLDENRDLIKKYDILSIQSIMIFKKGKEVSKLNGFLPKEALKQNVEANL
ncbi:thiol reductase thioredoxin [Clostridium botulinum]|nr:thioredoxin [Clostridium botulinum]MBY6805040.1 thiol reductase thioredoxin [Clostridium botulinum]MBY6815250.1 thiol reductase thioredoxin [Clostridium botulinum]MBY6822043.1 thiol reductase thioredoxin [Clostridium botulinum]NFI05766.1 thiol reductase thioredoxin [Clostridium botulinum]